MLHLTELVTPLDADDFINDYLLAGSISSLRRVAWLVRTRLSTRSTGSAEGRRFRRDAIPP